MTVPLLASPLTGLPPVAVAGQDMTGAGRFATQKKEIVGYRHQATVISVVGTGPSLPFDVEPYGPGDSEYAAGQRLLRRAVSHLGPRFADYVVVMASQQSADRRADHSVGLDH
jgi:hypothetical protein